LEADGVAKKRIVTDGCVLAPVVVAPEGQGSNRCVVLAVSVAKKRRPPNGCISACAHHAKERPGTYRRIELAVPITL
jgi:hypothetical protein